MTTSLNSQTATPTTKSALLNSLQLPLVQYLLLYLVVLCVFLPTFWYTYVWDDFDMIVRNQSIREWKNIPAFFTDPSTFMHDPGDKLLNAWRPLRNIYYLISYKLNGFHPAGWHFQHVLLHSLVSAMLLALFHRLYRYAKAWPWDEFLPVNFQLATWFAALAWAIHPANTEVTAWLKSADDILSCLFGIASLMVLFPPNHRLTYGRAVAAAILYALALMAKESIVPLMLIYPALLVILSPAGVFKMPSRQCLLAIGLLTLETLIYLLHRKLAIGKIEQVPYLAGSFSAMMATMSTALVRYLQLAFWPFWPTVQAGDYQGWLLAPSWRVPEVRFSVAVIAAFLVLVAVFARRSRVFLAGFVFVVLAFLPISNIVPMMQVMAERFMYFPMMGGALMLAAGFTYLLRLENKLIFLVPILLTGALGATTLHRLPVWVDNSSFHSATLEALPTGNRALFNQAMVVADSGNTTRALAMVLEVRKQQPDLLAAGLTSALLYFDLGFETSGTQALDEMIKYHPDEANPLLYKGDHAWNTGNYAAAADNYGKAINMGELSPLLHYRYGRALYETNNITSATAALSRTLELDPKLTSATVLLKQIKSSE